MSDSNRPRPIWLKGVLYVPVLDEDVLAAVRRNFDVHQLTDSRISLVELDELTKSVVVHDRRVRLTRTEFAILSRLVCADGQTVPLEELVTQVWGWLPAKGSAELVRTHIRSIRQKLEAAGVPDTTLRNVRGQGYCFRNSVQVETRDAVSA